LGIPQPLGSAPARGAKPGDIPVEQPRKFDLIINLTTAKALGLTIPEAFLLRANEVLE
jgi:putative tryptophan/tyrosine transport system substrate-binding protein